jgi:hypothetical protein
MEKQQQFITMVQTAIITKCVCDPGDGTMPISRPMWAIEHMGKAFQVAKHIPPDVTACEAAEAFIRWVYNQPLDEDDKTILQIILH